MKAFDIRNINDILSESLQKVIQKEMPLKQALVITRIATALSRNIRDTELVERIELLEAVLKKK